MTRTNRRLTLCAVLLVLNIGFIWGNSLLSREATQAFSGWVLSLLRGIFPGGNAASGSGHGLLRKLAHFTEFGCLGLLLAWLYSMLAKHHWLPLLSGFLVACTDETIQCFIPDRGPGFWDVCIDTAGVTLGAVLLLAGYTIYKKRKKQVFLEETQ